MPTYLVGPSRTYTTLQAAAAALPSSLPGTGIHRIIMDAGDYTLPTTSIVFPSSGDSSNYVQIEAAAGAEWLGHPSGGVRLLYSGASFISLDIREFGRVVNVVLITSGSHSCPISCFQNSVLQNVYIKTSLAGFVNTNQGRCTLINCIAQNDGSLGGFPVGFNFGNGNSTVLYNCGAYGFYQQYQGSLTTKAVNCWAVKNTGSIEFGGFWDPTSSNNASTNTSAPGSNCLTSQTVGAFGFADIANGDFHISSSSVLRSAGFDLSSIFTTDIDNQTILTPWPIGPDARNAAIGLDIASTGFRFKPWPACTIRPSILWIQDSAGYWNGSDRGAGQDAYEATAIFHGRESAVDALEQALDSYREAMTLSNFAAPLFAPNVDHTGTLSAVVLSMQRRQIQLGFPVATSQIYELEVRFRAIAPTLLATTPSLAKLRIQDGFDAGHSYTSPKAFTYGQTATYGDRRADVGTFEAPFSQSTAEIQAILAYLLTTARANTIAFPAAVAAVVPYPWGRARGAAVNCKVKSFSLSRKNLNRWALKIAFVEAP